MNQTVTITVTALDGTVLYTQAVQGIDMLKLTQLVNTPPPEPPKPKKKRSDAGKPRGPKVSLTPLVAIQP